VKRVLQPAKRVARADIGGVWPVGNVPPIPLYIMLSSKFGRAATKLAAQRVGQEHVMRAGVICA
jgi:hypothetical protein